LGSCPLTLSAASHCQALAWIARRRAIPSRTGWLTNPGPWSERGNSGAACGLTSQWSGTQGPREASSMTVSTREADPFWRSPPRGPAG
jgi:hypothetical protein